MRDIFKRFLVLKLVALLALLIVGGPRQQLDARREAPAVTDQSSA
ncbi:MAG: hypothetical protein QOJ46_1908 [bacterium]|jgi:hypothetical protein|nr:hypothetical protein [Thermoleophilaceae bacterium]